MINSTALKQPLPENNKIVQIVRILNKTQQVPVSEPTPLCPGSLTDSHPFLLRSSAPSPLLDQDFLKKHFVEIFFSQKREIVLSPDIWTEVAVQIANQMK